MTSGHAMVDVAAVVLPPRVLAEQIVGPGLTQLERPVLGQCAFQHLFDRRGQTIAAHAEDQLRRWRASGRRRETVHEQVARGRGIDADVHDDLARGGARGSPGWAAVGNGAGAYAQYALYREEVELRDGWTRARG